jgi:addiction module HigA family antidote
MPMTSKSSIIIEDRQMIAVHPGEILSEELEARGLSANQLALSLRVPSGRITEILNGKRAVTPDTALRLARYFGNSADFWLGLQTSYELALAERDNGERIAREVVPANAA